MKWSFFIFGRCVSFRLFVNGSWLCCFSRFSVCWLSIFLDWKVVFCVFSRVLVLVFRRRFLCFCRFSCRRRFDFGLFFMGGGRK